MGILLSQALVAFSQGFVSIENYKLPSDPDDTLAFQRAIDAMPESTGFVAGGGILMLDGKTYNISDTIVIDKSIKIIGAGSDSGTRILLAAQSNCNMFEIGKRDSSDPISVTLDGMRIQMSADQKDGYSNVVTYNYVRHCHFIDLFCVNATAPNFLMTTDAGQEPGRNNYFYGCAFEYGKEASLKILHNYNLNINSCYFGFGLTGQNSRGLYVSMAAERFIMNGCWFLQDNRAGDMHLTGIQNGQIVNTKFSHTTDCAVGSAQISIGTCNGIEIANNILPNTECPYNILVAGTAENVHIHGNMLMGSLTQPYYFDDKTKVVCNGNVLSSGLQENNGSATIANAATYVEVTHGVFTTPDNVIATPQGDENVWISNIGATTFRINRAASSGDLICNWMASVKTY